MHVLIALIKVDSQFTGSGISRAVADRCRMLTARGHRVTVAASFDDCPPWVPCSGVEALHVPLKRRAPQAIPGLNDALHGRAIGAALHGSGVLADVDVVDVQEAGIARGVYAAARGAGRPVTHSIHLSALYGRARFGPIRQRVYSSANVWAAANADRSMAVSECVKQATVRHGVPAERIAVVYNPVRIPPAAKGESGDAQVLWLSRMVEGKGVDEAAAIAEEASRAPGGPRFAFVGGGAAERAIQEAAARNPRITWHGVVRDPAKLDRIRGESSAFLATSEHETFGLAVAEAMAAGLPVIASDIEAHREVLSGCGRFYSVGAVHEAVRLILDLASSPAEHTEMGMAGRERATALFAEDRCADALIAAYRDAIAGCRR